MKGDLLKMTNKEKAEVLGDIYAYLCGEPGKEAPEYTKMREAMQSAISAAPSGEQLTLDQLREMDGQPVWVEFEDGSGGLWGIVHKTVFDQIVFPSGLHCTIGHPYYGKTYKAYAYPPAHIDQDSWEDCPVCGKYKSISFRGFRTKEDAMDLSGKSHPHIAGGALFCPRCGKPRTPEAWAELERRLRG